MRCARYAERNMPVFSSALTCVWADVGRPRKTERGERTHQEGLARRAVLHGRELDAVEDGHRAQRAVGVLELCEPEALRLVRGRDEALERLDRAARLRRLCQYAYGWTGRGGRTARRELRKPSEMPAAMEPTKRFVARCAPGGTPNAGAPRCCCWARAWIEGPCPYDGGGGRRPSPIRFGRPCMLL
jgi:hypothetical protein